MAKKITKHTLAIKRRPGKITIRHVDGSGEIGEFPKGVAVSLWGGGVRWRFPELPLVLLLKTEGQQHGDLLEAQAYYSDSVVRNPTP